MGPAGDRVGGREAPGGSCLMAVQGGTLAQERAVAGDQGVSGVSVMGPLRLLLEWEEQRGRRAGPWDTGDTQALSRRGGPRGDPRRGRSESSGGRTETAMAQV